MNFKEILYIFSFSGVFDKNDTLNIYLRSLDAFLQNSALR